MSHSIKTLTQARERIAALEAELKRKPAAEVSLPVESGKPNVPGGEGKPTVDSILANLEAKLITFSEAKAGLQAAAKIAKPGADQNKAFKALARVQKAEALERLANLPRGKRRI